MFALIAERFAEYRDLLRWMCDKSVFSQHSSQRLFPEFCLFEDKIRAQKLYSKADFAQLDNYFNQFDAFAKLEMLKVRRDKPWVERAVDLFLLMLPTLTFLELQNLHSSPILKNSNYANKIALYLAECYEKAVVIEYRPLLQKNSKYGLPTLCAMYDSLSLADGSKGAETRKEILKQLKKSFNVANNSFKEMGTLSATEKHFWEQSNLCMDLIKLVQGSSLNQYSYWAVKRAAVELPLSSGAKPSQSLV